MVAVHDIRAVSCAAPVAATSRALPRAPTLVWSGDSAVWWAEWPVALGERSIKERMIVVDIGAARMRFTFELARDRTLRDIRFLSRTYGLSCAFNFTPSAVMETRVARFGLSGDRPRSESQFSTETRKTFIMYEFAKMREQIALSALSSADPTIKVGKTGVFIDDERVALSDRAVEIQKLTPYCKNGTISWNGADDLSQW